ncbi:hypothetical protein BKA61DRAFT_552779 [Leptodontidium sp. MPI-SDFR-AT-0119]|nr:hypothetical protein BKA61DRAFT_552779 [Leptodontidium sp. MPI-SDFR-AT-0119]
MEQYGMPFEAINAPTPPDDSFSRPVAEAENPDEWEYEYSTTETETFYVTLDLTTPEVPATQRQIGRRNAKGARWTNPGLGKHQRMARLPEESGYKIAKVLQIGGDDDDTTQNAAVAEEGVEEDDEEEEIGGRPRKKYKTKEKPVPEEEPRATEVQILDLHSVKPLVSYDGHIFACRWSENIGTELLFMPRDKEKKLPILRELKGEVDLLAASSARITARTAHLEHKSQEGASVKGKAKAKAKATGNSKVHITRGSSAQRNNQALFLEKLIDLKDDAGEEDYVTVHAKSRLTNNRWRKEMKALRAAERERLEQVIAERKNGPEIIKARERLKQMDEEDEELRKAEEEKGVAAGANGINKRKRPGGRQKNVPVTPSELANAGQAGPSGRGGTVDQFSNGMDGGVEQMGTPFTESTGAETPRSFETGMDDDRDMYGTPEGVQFQDDDLSDQDADGEDEDLYDY